MSHFSNSNFTSKTGILLFSQSLIFSLSRNFTRKHDNKHTIIAHQQSTTKSPSCMFGNYCSYNNRCHSHRSLRIHAHAAIPVARLCTMFVGRRDYRPPRRRQLHRQSSPPLAPQRIRKIVLLVLLLQPWMCYWMLVQT